MTTIIRAADEAHFLALIPHLLGFVPRQSLVLLPFHGSRTAGGLRLDLPRATDAAELAQVASSILGILCRVRDVDGVVFAVYTDADYGETGPPHGDLVRALERAADIDGVGVRGALCVAHDAWGVYPGGVTECPPRGWPLSELESSAPELPGAPEPAADQAAGARLPPADLVQKEQVGRAHALLTEEFASAANDVHELFADLVEVADGALGQEPDTLSPIVIGALVFALDRPLVRDVLIATWCFDVDFGIRVLSAQLVWRPGAPFPAALGRHMTGEGVPPVRERLRAAHELARWVAATAPRGQQAGALATCGWLAWALGNSTHAEHYARLALERDAEHGLAGIVSTIVAAGHLPSWWFDPSAHPAG